MKTLIALAVLAIPLIPTLTPAFKTLRDGSGNLRGYERRVGDRIEIRDSDNNLSRQINREGDRWIIRNGDNDKIGEVDRGSND
ncbi:MAG: hypothetical protein ACLPVO_09410 [Desulfomonilaceae bacterium]